VKTLVTRWLGRVPYSRGADLQRELVRDRRRGRVPDTLLVLEHPPVITLGSGARSEHILFPAPELRARGIEVHEAGRGGDVTYHGPGQLVGYPVVALSGGRRDAHRYLRDLEQALILTAADYGVAATRWAGRTGVWVGSRKLAAIGVRISSGWITSHGFAVNVGADLSGFGAIVPCGIHDAGVTSLEALTGLRPTLREVAARASVNLASVLGLRAVSSPAPVERLAGIADGSPIEARGVAR
jgi:lipoyl(octanoyl) transferase